MMNTIEAGKRMRIDKRLVLVLDSDNGVVRLVSNWFRHRRLGSIIMMGFHLGSR